MDVKALGFNGVLPILAPPRARIIPTIGFIIKVGPPSKSL